MAIEENERETAKVSNWAEMRALIKANLGAPILCVELTIEQLNMAIQNAVDFLQEYWSFGSFKDIMKLSLKADQRNYKIEDEGILTAIEIIGSANCTNEDYDRRPFSMEAMMARQMPMPGVGVPLNSGLALTDIEVMRQTAREWEFRLNTPFIPSWNDLDKVLTIEPTPTRDMDVGLVFYRREKIVNLFNRLQFRKLATAYAGIQWGMNLSKYTVAMPGGASVNAQNLVTVWKDEKDKWEEQVKRERSSYFTIG